MSKNSQFDDEIEGQMTIADLFEPPERLVAVSKIFARARKQMSLAEQKTFVLALSQLDWTKKPEEQNNVVHINKKTVEKVLAYESDSTDMSEHVWRAIKGIALHSNIEFEDEDRDFFDSGMFITRITRRKTWNYYRVKFEEEYFPLFTGLGRDYITMWSMDIFRMTSKRSVHFYELLRQMSYSAHEESPNVFSYGWGVKALKEEFGIPKDGKGSYMRSSDNGGFNRSAFEGKFLDPMCDDLTKTKMIQLIIQSDGKAYVKEKSGRRVRGYRFYWSLSLRPAIAEAHEVREITERIDQDPKLLKALKNTIEVEKEPPKKPRPKKKTGMDFEQREYDFDALEEALTVNLDGQLEGQMTIKDVFGEPTEPLKANEEA